MPAEAMPNLLRATLGKHEAVQLWKDVWANGIEIGRGLGRAEGAAAATIGFVGLALVALVVTKLINRSRGRNS